MQIYSTAIKEVFGMLLMIPVSSGVTVLKAIVSANR
jgi:hypothetical protein